MVVVPMFSLAEAIRMPTRCALRCAAAVFSALECVACAACEVVSREPSNVELLLPELDELPLPPPAPMGPNPKLIPPLELLLFWENALLPNTISLKA